MTHVQAPRTVIPALSGATDRANRTWQQRNSVSNSTRTKRARLNALISKGKAPAKAILKARILLKADTAEGGAGWLDARIVEALDTNLTMVSRTRETFVTKGIDFVLTRKKRETPPVPLIFDGEAQAKLTHKCMPRHRAQEFRAFLDEVERNVPDDLDIHLVMDIASSHKTEMIKRWFAKRPRWHMHLTPTSSSWINQVERFFALIADKQIKRGAHTS